MNEPNAPSLISAEQVDADVLLQFAPYIDESAGEQENGEPWYLQIGGFEIIREDGSIVTNRPLLKDQLAGGTALVTTVDENLKGHKPTTLRCRISVTCTDKPTQATVGRVVYSNEITITYTEPKHHAR